MIAAVDRREVPLAPLLCPFDRSAERFREVTDKELLCVDLQLAAEPAADLRRDHAHLVLSEAKIQRNDELHEMRDLRGRPERELSGLELRRDRTRFHRVRDETLVDDPLIDLDLGILEGLVDVATFDRIREYEVRPELLVKDRRACFEGLGRIDHDRKRLVVDRDQVRRAFRGIARVRDDGRDGVARVACLVGRDRHVLRPVHARDGDEDRQHAGHLEVLPGEDGDDAGLLLGGGRVDPADPRVGVRAAHERQVRHPLQHHVVGERPLARDEARVLFAGHTRADVGGSGCAGHRFTSAATFGRAPAVWRISADAERIAFTMLW